MLSYAAAGPVCAVERVGHADADASSDSYEGIFSSINSNV
jgi:hypothetical protein